MAIKKYANGSWVSASYRKYGTETDTITTLPATIIGDGTPITSYTIKGNMEQSGTPTPSSPIYPSECGDLVTSGEHAGQYKLPITLGSTTTDIYLGEVQSTRRIKKLVLTGKETWNGYQTSYYITVNNYYRMYDVGSHLSVCSHYPNAQMPTLPEMHYGLGGLIDGQTNTRWNGNIAFNPSPMISSKTDWISYLAAQYAAGTPVTVWYVLEEPETGIVNEPIRKIGDYVDSVSGTNLATSGTAQELDVDTTLKPSELDLTYHGWHEHGDTKFTT